MKFIIKIISAIIIVHTLYVLGVFLAPEQFDELAKNIGTYEFNTKLRGLKGSSDNLADDMLQIKQLQEVKDKTKEVKTTIETKIDQTNKVIDSVNNVSKSINEVQDNVNQLTDFSGSSSSGSPERQ